MREPDFARAPLQPAVVQDARTGRVRMVGFMDREAYEATLRSGELHLHSRARAKLWRKGETSGHVHPVRAVFADCDADAILVLVDPAGPTCHAGTESCFTEAAWTRPGTAADAPVAALQALEAAVAQRLRDRPEASYTAALAAAGLPRAAQKVGEEAVEAVVAALAQDPASLVAESADLLYHLAVVWALRGISVEAVMAELLRRRDPGPEKKPAAREGSAPPR